MSWSSSNGALSSCCCARRRPRSFAGSTCPRSSATSRNSTGRSGSRVLEARAPRLASTLRGAIEDAPHRPHEVDVAFVLAWFRICDTQLARPEVVDLLPAPRENMREGPLLARLILGVVVAVEGVVR